MIPAARSHKIVLEGALGEVPKEVQLEEVLKEVLGGVCGKGLKEVPKEVDM